MLEDDARHHAIAIEREIAAGVGELGSADMPPRGKLPAALAWAGKPAREALDAAMFETSGEA